MRVQQCLWCQGCWIVQHGSTGNSRLEGGDGEASAAGVEDSGRRCSWHS